MTAVSEAAAVQAAAEPGAVELPLVGAPDGATAGRATPDRASPGRASPGRASPGRYADRSDEDLTALAASWDTLDRHQRRALLTEMKLRMARNGRQEGALRIHAQRRYGRIIRQADGRVIHIETKIVRTVTAEPRQSSGKPFGAGFEQRVQRQPVTVPLRAPVAPRSRLFPPGLLRVTAPAREAAVRPPVRLAPPLAPEPAQPQALPLYPIAAPQP